jgi:acetyl-CoA acetyltransferase family protein
MTRVAVVGGARTPFVKAGGKLSSHSFLELGTAAVFGALKNAGVAGSAVDELVFSTVLLDPRMPNAARELVLRSDLPDTLSAHFISNNCISGLVAATFVRDGIISGRIKCGVAGGSESMSRPALSVHKKAEDIFLRLARARSMGQRLSLLAQLRPKYFLPQPPSPKEPSTGMTMGQHCEITAKEFGIKRDDQDAIALASHLNAAAAQDKGYLEAEIVECGGVSKDNIIRKDTSLEKLSGLKPVFDRSASGTLTAGNSSPLTDGASAVVLMSEEAARSSGANILGYIEDVSYAAINPDAGLLMAPGLALPDLMHRNNLTVDSVDYFEIHEAFAAQVLSNMQVWEAGWDRFPSMKPIGKIPTEKINVNGGSIAIGHPFAATGGRLIVSLLNQLQRSGKSTGVISVCAAGAMGCAMLLRRE